ncbi:LCP family protein [Streptomyces sp. XM4193]|uniref:LCP family protein n=1 Tax=Streptomyces sp. XM4193 TaxID=2929782 RepID=UPI001FF9BA0F|nr:LCP family protein [Streptomyces sp. XM4193]MCK1796972.1 LCP family protein [Streptomyces sp. XM4193]
MDTHGRGRSGDVDPADQWVFDPETGSYELRLNAPDGPGHDHTGSPSAVPGQRNATGGGRRRRDTEPGDISGPSPKSGDEESEDRSRAAVPGQRSRRRAAEPQAGRSRRKRKPGLSRKQKVLRWGGGSLALLLVVLGTTGYLVYQHFNNNIDKVDVGIKNDATTDGPVNILILGTDARSGKGNDGYGDRDSKGHADTTVLLHVAKDRSHATALSIPRDMVVDIPDCPTQTDEGEQTVPGSRGARFNESLGQNGRDPGCTWRTVEELTGIKINHFMMADFNAVKELSTAVGGVEVCVAKDIDDKKSKLKLTKGKHKVQGEDALAFVRTRGSVGLGSDLSRIELQQQFLSSMFREVKSSGSLSNPKKAWNLANAATDALTVDTGIGSVKKLAALASDLQSVSPKNITFATVPVLDNPNETVKSTVVLDHAKATPLFEMIKADKSLAGTKKDENQSDKKGKQIEKAPKSEVRVDIYNGGGPIGSAQQTVSWLQNDHGVRLSTNSGNAPAQLDTTTLEFGSDQEAQAATLADLMGLAKSALKKKSSPAGDSVPMTLTLGADFKAAGTPIEAPDKAPDGVQNINGDDKDVCAK